MSQPKPGSGRGTLIMLALLFAAPVVFAYLYYYAAPSLQPEGRINQGHLVTPARPLDNVTLKSLDGEVLDRSLFRNTWTLLYIGSSDCGEICRQMLWNMRQVRLSLHRRMDRVQRVFAITDRSQLGALQEFLQTEHEGVVPVLAEGADARSFVQFFSLEDEPASLQPDNIYVLDPLGNWMMFYTPDDPAKGMLKDLKKMLKLSQIG